MVETRIERFLLSLDFLFLYKKTFDHTIRYTLLYIHILAIKISIQ